MTELDNSAGRGIDTVRSINDDIRARRTTGG